MAVRTSRRFEELARQFDREKYRRLSETLTFPEYLDRVYDRPRLAYSAYQRLYNMIIAGGTYTIERYRRTVIKYKFFNDSEIPIFGLEETLENLVKHIKGAANWHGTEKRILLLHGPVGSSKSTICRLLKRGLERFSAIDDGAIYTYTWTNLGEFKDDNGKVIYPALDIKDEQKCPMNDDPLKLVPTNMRKEIEVRLNQINEEASNTSDLKNTLYPIRLTGELNPQCDFYMTELLKRYNGDWGKVVENHIRVHRIVLSESKRIGIGTFQPKDPKNQDATELTGDINYTKLAHYGVDSDPRCIAGDSVVSTEKGLVKIGSLVPGNIPSDTFVEANISVSSLDNARTANCYYYGGKKPTYKLTTRLGYSLTSTNQHKLLSIQGGVPTWKKVADLENGDYVALGRITHTWSENDVIFTTFDEKYYGNEKNIPVFPKKMNEELGYLFGLWIGDGHFYTNEKKYQYEFGWTQKEDDARRKFANLFKKYFGIEMHESISESHSPRLTVGSRVLCSWLKECVGLTDGAANKSIPQSILQSSKKTIAACLRGLWETDGGIRENYGSNTAGFTTVSKVLAEQVHVVLLHFGIVSSLVYDGSCNCYRVLVFGENVNKLIAVVPSLCNRFTTGEEKTCKSAPNVDVLPNIKPLLRTIYKSAKNRHDLKKRFSGNLFDTKKPNISYQTVKDFIQSVVLNEDDFDTQFALEEISQLVESNYVWLEVQSVQAVGEQDVYDFSVPETHAYWANGFISHNSFGFDGEFEIANRGFIEFIEVLKLEKEFLYDLLGVCQERQMKPKKFPQIDVDMVIIGHTNNPEFLRLQQDVTMEALRDRTVRVDVPYLTRLSDEIKVLEQDYGKDKVKTIHIAPHTLEIAALWAILTRLKDGKDNVSLVTKAKLYDGRSEPGWTEDRVKELRDKYPDEGMSRGISARYVQNKIANALVSNPGYVNMFMVLNEIKNGLGTFALIVDENDKQHYENCIELVKKELDDILKKEVQKALVADENAIVRLYTNYIDNVVAHVEKTKITDPFTGAEMEPDERLMRSIEEKADIGEQYADDFRRQIATYIGTQHMRNKEIRWDSNPKLAKALEKKLFEDTKDTIKLSALSKGATVGDRDLQEKIDAVKTRMIRNYGYNEQSATDVLNYVSQIFSRQDQ